MGLTYNVTEDYLYQQGKETRNREIVVKMLRDKTLTIEKIAEMMDVTVEYVNEVASQLKD
jgi:predicted transposase YdaD